MEINRAFHDIYSQFRNRMQSLYILNRRTLSNDLEEIEAAKRLVQDLPIDIDKDEISDISYLIDKIALKFQSREAIELDEIMKDYGADDIVDFNSSRTSFTYKPEITKAFDAWAITHKVDAKKLISFQRKSRINSPTRGDIIRQGVLVYSVTYFEMLLGDLLQVFFAIVPDKLPKEKTFKYEELLRLETLEAITQQAISDEADALLRLGYKDIPNAFSKRTGVDISEVKVYSNKLIELFERRNLFVHNNGRIDSRYMKKVSKDYLKQINARINLLLAIPSSYLEERIDAILIVGTMISQRIWRKYSKDYKLADYSLTELIFEKLIEGRYRLVINLADFALGIAFSNKASRYAVIINSAIAYDKLGEKVNKEKALKKISNVQNLPISQQIAYYAVSLEKDKAIKLLQIAVPNGDIDEVDLQDWPALEYLENELEFIEIKRKLVDI